MDPVKKMRQRKIIFHLNKSVTKKDMLYHDVNGKFHYELFDKIDLSVSSIYRSIVGDWSEQTDRVYVQK